MGGHVAAAEEAGPVTTTTVEELSPEHQALYDDGVCHRYCYECDAAHMQPYTACPECGNPKLVVTTGLPEIRAERQSWIARGWKPTYFRAGEVLA